MITETEELGMHAGEKYSAEEKRLQAAHATSDIRKAYQRGGVPGGTAAILAGIDWQKGRDLGGTPLVSEQQQRSSFDGKDEQESAVLFSTWVLLLLPKSVHHHLAVHLVLLPALRKPSSLLVVHHRAYHGAHTGMKLGYRTAELFSCNPLASTARSTPIV